MKRKNRPVLLLSLLIFTMAAITAGLVLYDRYYAQPEYEAQDNLVTTILKVGKADAMIIQNEGQTLVLDTGEDDDGEELVEYLVRNNIESVDALIITHYDKDHVGGADTLLNAVEVKTAYLPDYIGTITEYEDFMAALALTDTEVVTIADSVSFALGSAQVQIDPPASYEIEDETLDYDNNFSLITTITYGDTKLLFTGDAEAEELTDWLASAENADCDFIKIPHHGEFNSQLENLLKAATPSCAAICDSDKNPANETVLSLLEKYGVAYAQTANGDITVVSDGTSVSLVQ